MDAREFDDKVANIDRLLKTLQVDELKIVVACIMIVQYARTELARVYADDDTSGKSPMEGVQLACVVHRMAGNLREPDKSVFGSIGKAIVEKLKLKDTRGKRLWRSLEEGVDDIVKKVIVAHIKDHQFKFDRVAAAWVLVCKQITEEAAATRCTEGTVGYIASKTRKSKRAPWIPRAIFEALEATLIGFEG